MTEEQIKEMLKDIIDHGAEYECRYTYHINGKNLSSYRPYELGEGIIKH